MYLFTFELSQRRLQSYLAAFTLLFSGTFWLFSEHGEVYVPQLCFILLSAVLIMHKKPLISSLFFLFAVSITPTSCLALPPLIYLFYFKGYEKKIVLVFVSPIFLFFCFLLLWDFHSVMAIVKWAVVAPEVFFKTFSYKALLYNISNKLIHSYGKSFNLFSFISLFAFFIMFKQDRKLWFLMALFFLPFSLYLLNIGLFSGHHLLISFIACSFLVSYGLCELLIRTEFSVTVKYSAMLLLTSLYIVISFQLFISPAVRDSHELGVLLDRLASEYNSKGIIITDFDFGMAFWYFTQSETDIFLFTGRPNMYLRLRCLNTGDCFQKLESGFWINLPHLPDFFTLPDSRMLLEDRPIYFIDRSYWPTTFVRFLLSDKSLEKRKSKIPRAQRLKRYLDKKLEDRIEFLKIIDSPLRSVYVFERT